MTLIIVAQPHRFIFFLFLTFQYLNVIAFADNRKHKVGVARATYYLGKSSVLNFNKDNINTCMVHFNKFLQPLQNPNVIKINVCFF